jgi:hypothetical protein
MKAGHCGEAIGEGTGRDDRHPAPHAEAHRAHLAAFDRLTLIQVSHKGLGILRRLVVGRGQ